MEMILNTYTAELHREDDLYVAEWRLRLGLVSQVEYSIEDKAYCQSKGGD